MDPGAVEDIYDEFGNYIGPELDESDSDVDSVDADDNEGATTTTTAAAGGARAAEENAAGSRSASASANTNGHANALTVRSSGALDDDGKIGVDSRAVILPDDVEHYPAAETVFGPGTEVLVEEDDAQSITEPIIAPNVVSTSALTETEESQPSPRFHLEYLASAVLSMPALIRNVALVGALHHGKSSLADMLLNAAYDMRWEALRPRDFPVRYMDARKDERKRHMSLKTNAATLLLPGRASKSYGVSLLDTPGHPDMVDETIAALAMADGVVVLLDAAEGMTLQLERILEKVVTMRMDVVLVMSKIDRLICELRLPPQDAYHKIRHNIDEFNIVLRKLGGKSVSPAKGNVAFSSSQQNVLFTLEQFAQRYIDDHGGERTFPMSARQLAKCFWGDVYYDEDERQFTHKAPTGFAKRTFVQFVLEPLYKLHAAVVGLEVKELKEFLSRNHLLDEGSRKPHYVYQGCVRKGALKQDAHELLRSVNSNVFGMGSVAGFVDMVVRFIASPAESTSRKLHVFDLPRSDPLEDGDDLHMNGTLGNDDEQPSYQQWADAIAECSRKKSVPFTGYVAKIIPDATDEHFDALMRVMSGELQVGDAVRVLGDSYHPDDNDEDQANGTVSQIFLPVARFNIPVTRAGAGQLVLVRGISESVTKSATVVCQRSPHSTCARIMKPLAEFLPPPVLRIAVEPYKPAELPKMVTGIRKCLQTYPALHSRVEQSGEHVLVAPGELYMDAVMRDLRDTYGRLQVRVSDPIVPFAETVVDASKLHCYADTPNKRNRITMTAEPLEEKFLAALEAGRFECNADPDFNKKLPALMQDAGWDAFAAKSVWAFGPHPGRGPNVLVNDILDPEERKRAEMLKDSIVQGFVWAAREGPLTDEPLRGVKLRIIEVKAADTVVGRSPAQLIPAARRVAYSAVLTACPRMVEPIYTYEVQCPPDAVDTCRTLIKRRRGNLLSTTPVAATPLSHLRVDMPVLDSFGFEVDLRNLTQGAAFCTAVFSHWALVPGDPLDRSVALRPLEPAGRRELAKECMVKTRRRKGMPDDVSITKYFDDPLLAELAQDDEELKALM